MQGNGGKFKPLADNIAITPAAFTYFFSAFATACQI